MFLLKQILQISIFNGHFNTWIFLLFKLIVSQMGNHSKYPCQISWFLFMYRIRPGVNNIGNKIKTMTQSTSGSVFQILKLQGHSFFLSISNKRLNFLKKHQKVQAAFSHLNQSQIWHVHWDSSNVSVCRMATITLNL